MFGIGFPELFIILFFVLFFVIYNIIWDYKFYNYIFRKSKKYKTLEYETNRSGGMLEMDKELERRIAVLDNQKDQIVVKLEHLENLIWIRTKR